MSQSLGFTMFYFFNKSVVLPPNSQGKKSCSSFVIPSPGKKTHMPHIIITQNLNVDATHGY